METDKGLDIIDIMIDTVVDIMFDTIEVEMGLVGGEGRASFAGIRSTLCHVGILKTLSRQHIITCLAHFPPSEEGAPQYQDHSEWLQTISAEFYLVVVGILEVYHQLPPPLSPVSPPGTNPLPCEHHRGRSLTYNLKDKRSDHQTHIILFPNIDQANAETRDT